MINVLVFPCGSEIGLEVYRSLRFIRDINLVGVSSVDDHGKFIYQDYISGVPYFDEPNFDEIIIDIIKSREIDIIYPCMDSVSEKLKSIEDKLGCIVIGSSLDAQRICNSKSSTYHTLRSLIHVPEQYASIESVGSFPVFIKQDDGYGSRCGIKANNKEEARVFINNNNDKKLVLCEYLPGDEYTIDCFTDSGGHLLFSGSRKRGRISNGISVQTETASVDVDVLLTKWAHIINETVTFVGAWFFQVKMNSEEQPCLLEMASRFAGSSSYHRLKGVNFAYLSVLDALGYKINLCINDYALELDRALDCRFILGVEYDELYTDLDDCLIINERVNDQLIALIYQAINDGKKVFLITRHHKSDLYSTLEHYRISTLFDDIFWLRNGEQKSEFIHSDRSILIDDSFSERCEVKRSKGIYVFSPDMVDGLLS